MFFLRRIGVIFILLLLTISIYKDLTNGNRLSKEITLPRIGNAHNYEKDHMIEIIALQLQPGDTILSVTEQLNKHLKPLDVQQVIKDFKEINPDVDPFHLTFDRPYYFRSY